MSVCIQNDTAASVTLQLLGQHASVWLFLEQHNPGEATDLQVSLRSPNPNTRAMQSQSPSQNCPHPSKAHHRTHI